MYPVISVEGTPARTGEVSYDEYVILHQLSSGQKSSRLDEERDRNRRLTLHEIYDDLPDP
jgi:hypothetical protein